MYYKIADKDKRFREELSHLMITEKRYRDTTLGLTDLSKLMGTPKRKISKLIALHFEKSFPDFLNDYRLEEVLLRFKNHDYEKHTIIAIALESGFPSKSTFYRYFKRKLGISPTEFLLREHGRPH